MQKTATNLDPTTDPTASYTRRYLYNCWNLVAEFSFNTQLSTLNLVRSYTWGLDLAGSFSATGGVGALLQITVHDTTNKNYFAAYDQNGNVAALTRDDGLLAAAYEYSPFGEPLRAEVSAADATMADNPFRFSTKYTDVESGLVYYGLRYYSPDLGRFINQDPIQEAGGLNLYGFVGNNPVNRIDRLGLKTVCIEVPAKGGRDGQTTKVCATDDGYIPANSKYVATVSGGLNSDGSFYGSINTIPRSDIYDSGAGSHDRNSGTGNGGNNSAFQLPTFYVNGTNDFDAIGWYNFRNAIDSSSAPDSVLGETSSKTVKGNTPNKNGPFAVLFRGAGTRPGGITGGVTQWRVPKGANGAILSRYRISVTLTDGQNPQPYAFTEAWPVVDGIVYMFNDLKAVAGIDVMEIRYSSVTKEIATFKNYSEAVFVPGFTIDPSSWSAPASSMVGAGMYTRTGWLTDQDHYFVNPQTREVNVSNNGSGFDLTNFYVNGKKVQ